MRPYSKLASLVAALFGCNQILGITDHPLAPKHACNPGAACESAGAGAGGARAHPGVSGSAQSGTASGGRGTGGDRSGGEGATAGESGARAAAGEQSSGSGAVTGVPAGGSSGGEESANGGAGGSVEPSTLGDPGDPCAHESGYGCVGHAQSQRLICKGGVWVRLGTCDSGSYCDTSTSDAGVCAPVVSECADQARGFAFCRNSQLFECGVDLVTADLVTTCPSVCLDGACSGECTPAAKDCNGGGATGAGLVPRVCQDDGTWLDGTRCPYLCKSGMCLAATCGDGVKNGDETDTDCGGSCGATCVVNQSCQSDGDCVLPASGKCKNGSCIAANCSDGVKNGNETGQDCGGGCPNHCAAGSGCSTSSDCDHSACVSGTCTGVCSPSQTGCSGVIPQSCSALGTWQNGSVTAGQCGAACTPSATQCSDLTKQQTCNASGAWNAAASCSHQTCVGTGVGSACQGVCAQGETQCASGGVQSCTTAGAWDTAQACSAPETCQGGACTCPTATPDACNGGCTTFQTDKFNCGSCGHGCQGGSCTAGVCQPFTLFTSGAAPVNIAVASTGLYWTDSGSGGFVYSTPLTGGSSTVASTFGGGCGIMGLAVDSTNIYGIARANSCTSIAGGTLMTAPLPGGTASIVSSSLGAGFPPQSWRFLAVDASNVYYSNFDVQDLYRVPKTGGTVTRFTSMDLPDAPMAVAVQGSNIYFSAQNTGVMQQAIGSSSIVQLASSGGGNFIAADASFVYYTDSSSLMKVSTSGSTPVKLAANAAGPLVIDASNVYYLGSSTVMMIAKTGGTARTLATGQSSMVDIAADATSVYWAAGKSLMKCAR